MNLVPLLSTASASKGLHLIPNVQGICSYCLMHKLAIFVG